ncbi:MAG: YlxR family protein [Anaerolineales bacterium]|jgi:hypothetical protein
MSARKPVRRRHIPQRTCVGCRETQAKRGLIRVVRGPDGIEIDPSGKAPGRGAYVHEQRSCWEKALAGPLARALRTELDAHARRALEEHMDNLSDEQNG